MSVWIKGARKEHDCIYCPIEGVCHHFPGGEEGCPMIDIPTPHGKLIDADELMEMAQKTRCFRGDYALLLSDVIDECTVIVPEEE